MKKLLLASILAFSVLSTNAQLDDGCKAQNFTFTALNNNSEVVDLYTWLDAGKYVFLDVSATWCGPCWSYHNAHHLNALYKKHGPGTATNNVRVVFVEGDGSTTDAQMGGASGSQGNWLTGTAYPMCNPDATAANTFGDNYEIGYFPTVYMICPDRTIREVGQLDSTQLYAQVAPTANCASKINVDVTPNTYNGKLFSCDGNFTFDLTIKNRGFNNLTNASITIKNGSTTLTTVPWTGSLTTYQVSANIPVTLSGVSPSVDSLTFDIIATGDQITTNNKFTFYIDNYAPSNTVALPFNDNLDSYNKFPTKFGFANPTSMSKFGFYDGINGATKLVGVAGNTKGLFVNFYQTASGGTGIMPIGNFNTTTSSPHLNFDFDMAYAQYNGSENDLLEVVVSTDCGANWTSKWSKSGSGMSTTAAVSPGSFMPNSVNQWRHESVNLNSIKNNPNALVAFRMTSAYGNYAWLDNLKLNASNIPSSVDDIEANNIDVYPNPTIGDINIRGVEGDASFQLIDVMGRIVRSIEMKNISGEIKISTTGLTTGNYSLKINSSKNTIVKSVIIAE